MQVRNITPLTLYVPVIGRNVEPDELVTVPESALGQVWPEETWEVIGSPEPPPAEEE